VTFDRSRAALDALSGMSRNEIDRITSLAITGESFDKLVDEVRDAVSTGYRQEEARPDPDDLVDTQNIVPTYDGDLLEYLNAVGAAFDDEIVEAIRAKLNEVYGQALTALIDRVEEIVDAEEQEADDEDEDEDSDPDEDTDDD
jgi:hypothetical protein